MKNNSIGYSIIVSMLFFTSLFSLNLFLHGKDASDKLDVRNFPCIVDGWAGRDLAITEKEYQILETRNLISREYTNPSGVKLWLLVIYSETNRSVFHPPEVCLIGEGITIVDKKSENVESGKHSFLTNKLNLEKNGFKEIVLYSYKAGKLYTENFYLQQLYLIAHQIFGKRVSGATVRVSMAVGKDEGATLATLKEFLSRSAVVLDRLSG